VICYVVLLIYGLCWYFLHYVIWEEDYLTQSQLAAAKPGHTPHTLKCHVQVWSSSLIAPQSVLIDTIVGLSTFLLDMHT
jgi:hypothetical protein